MSSWDHHLDDRCHWGVPLTKPAQPVNPQTTGCGCGRTNLLHVFPTCDIRIMCRHISLVLVLKISRRMGMVCLGPWRHLSVILSPSAKRACWSRIYSICRWVRIYERVSSSCLEVFPSVNWLKILSWYIRISYGLNNCCRSMVAPVYCKDPESVCLVGFNLLATDFFLILAHPVFNMWVIQKPNKVALWNKRHFEEKKMEIIQHV